MCAESFGVAAHDATRTSEQIRVVDLGGLKSIREGLLSRGRHPATSSQARSDQCDSTTEQDERAGFRGHRNLNPVLS